MQIKLKISGISLAIGPTIICAYLLFPFISNGSFSSILHLAVQGILVLYIIKNLGLISSAINQNHQNKKILFILSLELIVIALLSVLFPLVHGTNDFSYLTRYYRNSFSWFTHFLCIFIIAYKQNKNAPMDEFMKIYIRCCVWYVLFSSIMIFIPSVKNIVISVVRLSDYQKNLLIYSRNATRIGWSGFTGYDGAMKCCVGAVFLLYQMSKSGNYKSIGLWLNLLLLLLGNFYYARTGVVAFVGLVFFFVVYMTIQRGQIKLFFRVAIIVLLVGFATYFVIIQYASQKANIAWMTGYITKLVTTKSIETESLPSYIKLPTNQFLFGIGRYSIPVTDPLYTDAGPMRLIYMFGILGTVFCYCVFLKALEGIRRAFSENAMLLSIMFIISFAIFEYKGEAIGFFLAVIIPFLMFSIFYEESKIA